MKIVLNVLRWIAIVVALLVAVAYFSGNQFLLKGVWAAYLHGNSSATIGDSQFFDTRTVVAGTANPWKESSEYNKTELSERLRTSLDETRSVAFLIAQHGEIIHEEYWDGYGTDSQSNSFSMAKSITTMLAQCAIQDGVIESWDEKAIKFLPELKGEFAAELTLRNLSTMTAGLDFNEHYSNPFDITAKLYYGPDVEKLMMEEVPVSEKAGTYEYQSGATQLLGLALIKATGSLWLNMLQKSYGNRLEQVILQNGTLIMKMERNWLSVVSTQMRATLRVSDKCFFKKGITTDYKFLIALLLPWQPFLLSNHFTDIVFGFAMIMRLRFFTNEVFWDST